MTVSGTESESNELYDLHRVFDEDQAAGRWYTQILDSINNGILVMDENLIVRYINAAYTRITGVREEQIIGRRLSTVRPGAILPQVVLTGKAMTGVYRREGETEYLVDMAPILAEGKTIGGVSVVKDITEVRRLSEEVRIFARKTDRLQHVVDRIYHAKYTFDDIIGSGEAMTEALRLAKKAARGTADILITGESGTGKELFAQAMHNAGSRAEGPFVAVNCAAIAPSLMESELFGYEEGAFTGAKKGGRIGLFEIANGGTVFLDEIGELSLEMQAKLLRVLQERSIRRVGETGEIALDIRIVAATNRDLHHMVAERQFRADVYYRLNVLNVHLPPLRERGGDIGQMADAFFQLYFQKLGRGFAVDASVGKVFKRYAWPGNVRELRNVIEYAVNMCEENLILPRHLPKWFQTGGEISPQPSRPLADLVRDFERKVIRRRLEEMGSDMASKRRIAQELDISVATLYNKMKERETPLENEA